MPCCECCDSPGYQVANRWALVACTGIAWIFSVVTLANCRFLVNEFTDRGIGLFKYETRDSCESYWDDADFDTEHSVGRAFGVMANLSIATCLFGILAQTLFLGTSKFGNIAWLVTKIFYIVALLCVLITFSFVGLCDNSDICELGAAGVLNVMNVWILLGVLIAAWVVPPPPNPVFGGGGSGEAQEAKPDVEVAEEVTEDKAAEGGTTIKKTIEETPEGRKITEEVTRPDGTKTITETIERVVEE